jgi:hypothetical protein
VAPVVVLAEGLRCGWFVADGADDSEFAAHVGPVAFGFDVVAEEFEEGSGFEERFD